MTETYCGKDCTECPQMLTQSCPGCKAGPGRQFGGECELARCCRFNGHKTCGTCASSAACEKLQDCDQQPEKRAQMAEAYQLKQKQNAEVEQRKKEMLISQAQVLVKRFWILFWLVVPTTLASLMTIDYFAETSFGIYAAGKILLAVCYVVYGVVLLQMSSENSDYQVAGICWIVASGINFLNFIIFRGEDSLGFIDLSLSIVGLICAYTEYTSHSALLKAFDGVLSGKWNFLMKLYFGCAIGMIASLILILISPTFAMLVLLCFAVGFIAAGIMKLVYLYQTAKYLSDFLSVEQIRSAG